ncbi:MAG: DUF4190 domain-containing protein [Luteolibacter sp.]
MRSWFYAHNGAQLGPVDDGQFRAMIAQGRILPDTLVWREGMPAWLPLSQADLSVDAVFTPEMMRQLVPPRDSGLAMASLVCGILGMICFVPASIAAIICGHMALNQINNEQLNLGGRGLAIAGLICGYIPVALLFGFLIVTAASSHS